MPAPVIAAICGAQRAPALELHRVAPPSFMNRTAVRSAWVGALLVRAERQVGDDQRPPGRADHGADQREQLVDGDRQGGLVAVDVVGGRVADQQRRDAGLVEDARRCTGRSW